MIQTRPPCKPAATLPISENCSCTLSAPSMGMPLPGVGAMGTYPPAASAAGAPSCANAPGTIASTITAPVAARKFLALEGIRPSFILLRFPLHSCLVQPPDRIAPLIVHHHPPKIGSASLREGVCTYVTI